MTDTQYFFLMLVLILNGITLVLVGLAQHYHTQAIAALTQGLTDLIAAIGQFRKEQDAP